jgi:hypothetical protein
VLLAVFGAQETAEMLVRTGGLEQLPGLVGTAGVGALPAAILIGRLAPLALDGLDVFEATLARSVTLRPRAPMVLGAPGPGAPLHFPRLNLGFGFARRPPPPFAAL